MEEVIAGEWMADDLPRPVRVHIEELFRKLRDDMQGRFRILDQGTLGQSQNRQCPRCSVSARRGDVSGPRSIITVI